ncbi:MAG: TRAP transporter small permease [Pseudomonadota bacterium]|jgi:TRAP-type C4-dicarboxylate transport system permease small subunit
MSVTERTDATRERGIDALVRWVALAGGTLLVMAATMVVVSVTLRSDLVKAAGVPGDFELVQMATAVCAFAFLPLCQLRRGNIFVDTFTSKFPVSVNRAIDATWDVVFGVAMIVIAWRLGVGAMSAWVSGENSMVLRFPTYVPVAVCAVLAVLLAVVCFVTAARRVKAGS